MHTFLERVASICNATKQFMIDKFFTAVINKYVSLIVLFTIGIYLDITRIALYSAFIFIALMIKQFIDAKTVAYRVEYFDKELQVSGLFTYERAILRPADDSVVQVVNDRLQMLRRTRGYMPEPIRVFDTAGSGKES